MNYNKGFITIPHIISDAKRAIKANAQISALLTCFSLVDECASLEWEKTEPHDCKTATNETKFIAWYSMWFKDFKGPAPKIDGQLLYKIRCTLVHALSSNINFAETKLGNVANKNIKEFTLMFDDNCETISECISSYDENKNNSLSVNVSGLCLMLLHLVELYYEKNKDNLTFHTLNGSDFTGEYIKKRD